MVYSAELDHVFLALSDPTRRAIVQRLARAGDTPVSELAAPFDMTLPGVGKHLTVLERAGLVERERVGRVRMCRLKPAPLRSAQSWIEQYTAFWNEKLERLAAYIDENPDQEAV